VPITAAWNGVIAWLVLREARVRAMGPSAASEMLDTAFEDRVELSPSGRLVVLGAVASSILRTKDLHPNLVALMTDMVRRTGPRGSDAIGSSAQFLQCLAELDPREKRIAFRVLVIAAIVDGRLTRDERRLLREAHAVVDGAHDARANARRVEALRRAFVSGNPIVPETIRSLA
jgi:hypothetical protein